MHWRSQARLPFIRVVQSGGSNMALIDLLQVVHRYTAFGVNCANIYHVERANAGESAQDINDAFTNSILPSLRLLQTTDYANIDLVAFNLGDPLDFHTFDLASQIGDRTGINSPSFVAAGMRFPTLNRLVRSGQKRFAGLTENDYVDGVLDATAQALVEDIGDVLIADWLASSDSHVVCNYAIIQRVCDEVEPVTGKCLQYRLPEPPEVPIFYIPNARQLNLNVTSQVSRKVF